MVRKRSFRDKSVPKQSLGTRGHGWCPRNPLCYLPRSYLVPKLRFGNALVPATLLRSALPPRINAQRRNCARQPFVPGRMAPDGEETEFPRHVRSQTEFGNEESDWFTAPTYTTACSCACWRRSSCATKVCAAALSNISRSSTSWSVTGVNARSVYLNLFGSFRTRMKMRCSR